MKMGTIRDQTFTNGKISAQTDATENGTTSSNSNHIKMSEYSTGLLTRPRPIAICGMAMRLPGGIHDDKALWEVLYNGKDMRVTIPEDRYNAKAFSSGLGKKGAIETQHGYFLTDDLSCLDASFFSMTKSDLERTDPQQRQILEVTRECLESAGDAEYRGKDIGFYVGTFGEDWLHSQSKENQFSGTFMGSGDLMIANRVMVIKTGCSASLVALHHACQALLNGDCSAAIVGGTSLIMGPHTTAAMTQQGVLSPDGSCNTFDASANGFARADAINAVYIKLLDDAIRDGNPIRAVIRGTWTNSDGKSASLTAPSCEAQTSLMRKVYERAQLDPARTAFVECHGTGTATGDPIGMLLFQVSQSAELQNDNFICLSSRHTETTAVGNVFGETGVYIGSLKPNIGHAEGASGLNSLIKAVLMLEHKTIVPQIKFVHPNPKIPFSEKRLKVPIQATPWPLDRAERVSVNSFGIGGTNAHVIIDSLQEVRPGLLVKNGLKRVTALRPLLMVLSANSQDSLKKHVMNLENYLAENLEKNEADIAYTLSQRREHLPYRTFIVTSANEDCTSNTVIQPPALVKSLANPAPITMVFSGQGAQWAGMAKDLIQDDPAFRKDIQNMDCILRSLTYPPNWSVENELLEPATSSRLERAEFAQPLCTAIQIALIETLRRAGIIPTAVAMIIAYYRGYVTKEDTRAGGMAVVGMGRDSVVPFLEGDVIVACENSPDSSTISGDQEAVQRIIETIKAEKPDVLARRLKVNTAYHSHHMHSFVESYVALVEHELGTKGLCRNEPTIPMYSSVHNLVINRAALLCPKYWGENLENPVRFHPAVLNILKDQPHNLFVEIGPHSTLAGPLRQILGEARLPCNYIPAMIRSRNCSKSLLSALGQLFQQGAAVDFKAIIPRGEVVHDLPAYAWDHSQSHWAEPRVSKHWRFRPYGHHALLGQRIPESTAFDPSWRVVLDLEDEPWLADHKVRDDIVFPLAGYVAMAGEAIRQLSGIETGYSVRHVVVHTALLLAESKPVEAVTSLRRRRLTDSADSDAYDFVISSWSGSNWIKNCEGLVRPMEQRLTVHADGPRSIDVASDRRTSASKWYEIMARVGLVYGPEFQGITSLSSSTTEKLAAATITNSSARQNAPFPFHPATIDSCLQVVLAAKAQGVSRHLTQLCVPTLIEELDISHSTVEMNARAWSLDDDKDVGLECLSSDGLNVLRLRGAQMTPLEDIRSVTANEDRHAAARLEWYPDFDFMDVPPLFTAPTATNEVKRIIEELALLCILDSYERLQGLSSEQPHFTKFREWLSRQKDIAASGSYPIVENAASYLSLSREQRGAQINQRYESLKSTGVYIVRVAEGIMRIRDNTESLFTGSTDTLDLLMRDNVLTEIYNAVSFGCGDFVHMLAITKPRLRILEVGAGTGGTTEPILRSLASRDGNPAYSLYTFTDISAGFFTQARERFAYAPNMEYKVLDISRSAQTQGFEAGSYDLILAPNVVHATPSLNETLKNLKPLLRPDGHLVLSEVCAVARAPGYVFGNFSGWWLGEADNRKWEPYVMVDRWDEELRSAGFTGVGTAVYDADQPYQYCAAIVSQPATNINAAAESMFLTLLCSKPEEGVSKRLLDGLTMAGYKVNVANLDEVSLFATRHDIISTLEMEARVFDNINEIDFTRFQNMTRNLTDQTVLWLMPPTQVDCEDPRSAQTVGLFRVTRAELGISLNTLEINEREKCFAELVIKVFEKVRTCEDTGNIAPDSEYAVQDGVIKIGRYQPFNLEREVGDNSLQVAQAAGVKQKLAIDKPGLLESLHWVTTNRIEQLGAREVEVEGRAVGLNFKDIMVAMGVLKFGTGDKDAPIGLEITGVVSRVGSQVSEIAIGDRICGVAVEGCFSTHVVLLDTLVLKLPDELSFEEGATMPACYTTAVHALIEVGQLKRNQTLLVHSSCGGVGHASIEIAKMIGAETYCTVGSDLKRQYLVDKMGIPDDHIFNSRDQSFLPGIIRATNGRGVDLVLNSLSGELLHASWKCVAEFGKLVELGKRDLVGFGRLDMEPFLANRSYCCVDLGHVLAQRPAFARTLMQQWMKMYSDGHVKPIQSMSLFEASEIEQCFRHLQKGDHIGKAVVRFPGNLSCVSTVLQPKDFTLDSDASYLLTGGLGGLGRSIAGWAAEHGARHLVFLSRSAGKGEHDQSFFSELRSMNCSVTFVAGKVDDENAIVECIRAAPRPIKGIFHLAMVLRDGPMLDLSYEEWTSAVGPKVNGAWNLHNAFLDQPPLDFFVMTSSLVTLGDRAGQSNYAAANTFLESFCQYRHKMGLPASAIAVCPIDDVGFVSENTAVRRKLKSEGLYFLPESEMLDYMQLAILNSYPPGPGSKTDDSRTASWKSEGNIIMGLRSEVHLEDPACQVSWRRDRRMGTYHNVPKAEAEGGSSASSNNALKEFFTRVADDPSNLEDQTSIDLLAHEIGYRIFRFMMKPEEDMCITMSLTQIGMDSLMAIELRRWWKQAFGLDISVLEIMGSGTLQNLGKVAADGLKVKLGAQ
ncbi:hypothetical protein KVR01_007419 [Diaporthe batatas]|uniref:uncharacterized protein n=1 Tax=Diaporthe batatas TaxID=748121 RepID=UPI001D04EBBF|nr:uncharacterized protein KVR01_007419 [Diaporthe batatas]KAG8162941.1 hypothetical protein KVR01_007419 [Diaporthe batatas]